MKKIIFLIVSFAAFFTSGCKKFIDVNQDPNRPTDVQEALILSPVELSISHNLHAGFAAILAQHYTQIVALNQPIPNEGTYLLTNAQTNDDWSNLYARCLVNLDIISTKADVTGNIAYKAISKILTALCLGVGTDFWGDIPYSEALKGTGDLTATYDTQEDIYKSIQSLLDEGLSELDQDSKKLPGDDDLFYGGDITKWKKLAYTLKARYYIHLTKAPGHTAAEQATLALGVLDKAMASNDDDLKFSYEGSAGNENPWYLTFLPGSTLVLSSQLVDSLKARKDPRLQKIVAPSTSTGLFTGRSIGLPSPAGDLTQYSIVAGFYGAASSANYLVNYTEALFIKAEATFIKSGAAAAEPIYQDAIKTHMTKLGIDINSAEAKDYLTSRGTLTASTAMQRIIEEKSIANFLNPENWVDWRRTGYPPLKKVQNGLSEIPRRLLYPQIETISNPQPQQKAVLTDRVWWDAQ